MAVPNYKYSGVCYTATADQTTFALTTSQGQSIGYLKQEHIKVRTSADSGNTWTGLSINTDYVFADPATSIVLNTGAAAETLVDISRHTPMDDDYIDFQAGSLLTATELNTFDTWQLYIDQELDDGKANVDGSTPGSAVKSVTGIAPITVDNTNDQTPVVGIDQTDSTGDSNALTSDTRVMSEKAIDEAFKQYVGSTPATGAKIGQIRIDPSGSVPGTFYWNGTAWVQLTLAGPEGPPGPPGPAPGLQSPPATAATVPLNPDGTLGTATADVVQDPSTKDLKFLFGIPVGERGPVGPPGDGITYKGLVDATADAEPANPNNGDFYLNTADGSTTWTGLGTVDAGDRLVWNANTNQWDSFAAPPTAGGLQPGDNVSELVNDAGYLTAATAPVPALQAVLDEGNTAITDLWIGNDGETVKLLNTGNVEASADVKAKAFRIDLLETLP